MAISSERLFLILFLLAHVVGLWTGYALIGSDIVEENNIVNSSPVSGVSTFLMILVSTGILLLLYKFQMRFILRLWFFLAVFMTTAIVFTTFFGIAGGILAFVLAVFRTKIPRGFRNVADAISFAGAGALLGAMFGLVPVLILLVLASVYDVYAVFGTKHMVALAKSGFSTETFMGFSTGRIEKKMKVKRVRDSVPPVESKVKKFGALGGGDVVLPLVYSVTLLKLGFWYPAIFASIGGAVGLYFLFSMTQKGKFYPGLPPIISGALLGSLVGALFLLYLL